MTTASGSLVGKLLLPLLAIAGSNAAFPQGMAVGNRRAVPAAPLPAGVVAPTVDYRDIAAEAGLAQANISGGAGEKNYLVETTGTGVALIDFDNDGLLDIFFVNSGRLNEKPPPHRLYRNRGELRFEDVTEKASLIATGWGQGVCAGDVDNDGYTDLFVTHWGPDRLLRNRGGETFADESRPRGFAETGRRWSSGCAFLDFDRDGDLDLFVAHYVDFDIDGTPLPGEAPQCRWQNVPIPCGPRGLPAETMSLFANDGGGKFADVSEASGIAGPRNHYGLGVLTGDYDNDGRQDVYVACDSTASLLYRNKGDGAFEELGLFSGAAYNEDGQEQAGMGVAAGDYDGDGLTDIFKTNFASDTNTLYRNNGDFSFTDETVAAGLATVTQYVGWGAAFLDFDHDGRQDLFAVNGHVAPSVDDAPIDESFAQPGLLFWNRGDGGFHPLSAEAGPAVAARHSSRGAAAGDLDNDGDLEIVVVNMNEAPSLLQNFGPAGNWLLVRALASSGRDDIGARVAVAAAGQTQVKEIRSGGSYLSQSDLRVHFGLGKADAAEVSIRWSSGRTQKIGAVEANRLLTLRETRR